jgi:hypothetical protein
MATVYATVDTFVGTESGDLRLREGDEYDAADPLVKAHPDWFTTPDTTTTAPAAKKTAPRRK